MFLIQGVMPLTLMVILIYYRSAARGNISGKRAEVTWVAPIICDTNIVLVEVVDSCGLAASKKLEIKVIDPQSRRPHG